MSSWFHFPPCISSQRQQLHTDVCSSPGQALCVCVHDSVSSTVQLSLVDSFGPSRKHLWGTVLRVSPPSPAILQSWLHWACYLSLNVSFLSWPASLWIQGLFLVSGFDNCLCSYVISCLCQHVAHESPYADKGTLISSWFNIYPRQQAATAVMMLLEFFCS